MPRPDGGLESATDSELVELTRERDPKAYGELWRRYAPAGRAAARAFTGSHDPEDLVSEAFVRILRLIMSGGGPQTAFRAYLVTTVRNVAVSWHRAALEGSLEDATTVVDPKTEDAEVLFSIDKNMVMQAFGGLPNRWQQVLWYSEMEGLKPRQIAPLMNMSSTAVSSLALRAREGLRQSWIQVHLGVSKTGPEHASTISRLGAYTRGALGKRERVAVESHLASCAPCTAVAAEAERVAQMLPWALIPLVGGPATVFLATPASSANAASMTKSGHTRVRKVLVAVIASSAVIGLGMALGMSLEGPAELTDTSRATESHVPSTPAADKPTKSVNSGQTTPAPESSESSPDPREEPSPDNPRQLLAPELSTIDSPSISAIDTGSDVQRGAFLPIVSGTALPGATVSVSSGSGQPVDVVANSDGEWKTAQLTGFKSAINTVSVSQTTADGRTSPPSTKEFTLSFPAVSSTVTNSSPSPSGQPQFTVTLTGASTIPLQVSTDSGQSWTNLADSAGQSQWSAMYLWEDPKRRSVLVRHFSADRFGPSREMQISSAANSGAAPA